MPDTAHSSACKCDRHADKPYLPLYAEKRCARCGYWRGQHEGCSADDSEMRCPGLPVTSFRAIPRGGVVTVYLNQVGQPAQEAAMNREQMFDDVHDAGELITQAIGAGSMCWENVRAAGEFDSTAAAAIADAAFRRLQMLLAERFSAEPTTEVGQTVRTKRGNR